MMFEYRKAGREDLDLLVKTRVEMLRAVKGTPADTDYGEVEKSCRAYYIESFEEDIHVAYLAFDQDTFIGCGGISFYRVMPGRRNHSGRKAYIMNIYTVPEYRGQGIASQVVDLLMKEAHARNIHVITLDATEMGRPVYERYGFVPDANAMTFKPR
jgi:GNAT superfamily N-acetyltransferase